MSTHPGFHSLTTETDTSISVEGSLPSWLTGTLIRNGPGAFSFPEGSSVDHWFDGLAMLTRFTFEPVDGADDVIHYQNRFLRTDAYADAREGEFTGGFATGETTLRSRLAGFLTAPYDNTNIIIERVDNTFLALTESPRSVSVDPTTLETDGHIEYDGTEPTGQLRCAHFRRDPATGTLLTVDTSFGRTNEYHIYTLDSTDSQTHVGSVPTEKPAYMHSFGLTPRYVILTEFPLRLDPLQFLRPGRQDPFIEQFEWEPDRGTRIIIIDRTTGDIVAEPVVDPVFGFHHINAFERDGGRTVVFDLETVPDDTSIDSLYLDTLRNGELGTLAGRLERFVVDLGSIADDRYGNPTATVSQQMLYDDGTALPTASPAQWCQPHRYIYAMSMEQPVTEWAQAVMKFDTHTTHSIEYQQGADYFSEPIFVPNPTGNSRDDGVVLTLGLDADQDRSRLFVLSGDTLAERARVTLPHAVPFDFHGRYFPNVHVA
ncbi:carotenoid oxygenase family protein [Haloquadratum walsbyi]|uniref:carotenoid oxygenase family protein n=1 Tax=Haloquadratum walsbyi TaxID=293091 RepID=UPI0015F39BDD|nr:carotenoid oxygenase family protein [Haloquadratum walsbyi]